MGVAIDVASQRARHRSEIEAQRHQVFRATITTVQDIVNNFLTQVQLLRFSAQDRLPPDTTALLNVLIHDAAAKLKALSDVEQIIEAPMGMGLGIQYQEPAHLADATYD